MRVRPVAGGDEPDALAGLIGGFRDGSPELDVRLPRQHPRRVGDHRAPVHRGRRCRPAGRPAGGPSRHLDLVGSEPGRKGNSSKRVGEHSLAGSSPQPTWATGTPRFRAFSSIFRETRGPSARSLDLLVAPVGRSRPACRVGQRHESIGPDTVRATDHENSGAAAANRRPNSSKASRVAGAPSAVSLSSGIVRCRVARSRQSRLASFLQPLASERHWSSLISARSSFKVLGKARTRFGRSRPTRSRRGRGALPGQAHP